MKKLIVVLIQKRMSDYSFIIKPSST